MPIVRRIAKLILPGIESVEIEGHGVFNFRDGMANVSAEAAKILIDAGAGEAVGESPIVVTGGAPTSSPDERPPGFRGL